MSRVMLNPVLGRELKERMRGLKAFIAILVFLGFLTLTVWLVYVGNRGDTFGFDLERQTRLGRDVLEWMLAIMLVLMLFLLPGLTAGAVAGERERQTLLPLQITPLTPRAILWGKVMAALAYLVLLMVAALPLFAVAYQLGGVTLGAIARGFAALIVLGVMVASMVVAISTFAKRVQTATLLAYGFTALLCFGGPMLFGGIMLVDSSRGNDEATAPAIIVAANPGVFLAAATAGENIEVGATVLRPLREWVADAHAQNGGWFSAPATDQRFADAPGNGGIIFADGARSLPGGTWLLSLGIQAVVAAGLFGLAVRRLRIPSETER